MVIFKGLYTTFEAFVFPTFMTHLLEYTKVAETAKKCHWA